MILAIGSVAREVTRDFFTLDTIAFGLDVGDAHFDPSAHADMEAASAMPIPSLQSGTA
jgi:hypothetical protein